MHLRLEQYTSPFSTLLLVTDEQGALRALDFADYELRMHRLLGDHYGDYELKTGDAPASIIHALDAYFDGDFAALNRVRTATGGTPFQRSVWRALRSIEPGTTRSYGQIATKIG